MDEFDVIVIGAGAAGVAAARRLSAAHRSVRVLELRRRLGGRAWTLRACSGHDPSGFPLDLGCGWLHSADENELSVLAAEMGFTIDKTPPPWRSQLSAIKLSADERDESSEAIAEFFARLEAAGASATDQPADRLLEPGCRWNPLLNAISTYANGVELDRLSVQDYGRYRDTGINWRVAEGYGALIAALGAGLDVVFDCAATLVDFSGALVRIETPQGDMRARAAIITISTNVLCAGSLRFRPDLPDKMAAASVLPLGLADKLFLGLDGAEEFPKDSAPHRRRRDKRHRRLSCAAVRTSLDRGLFRRLSGARSGSPRRRRVCGFRDRPACRAHGQRHPQALASDCRLRLGARSRCARLLLPRPARIRGCPWCPCGTRCGEAVLRRRGVFTA